MKEKIKRLEVLTAERSLIRKELIVFIKDNLSHFPNNFQLRKKACHGWMSEYSDRTLIEYCNMILEG